VYNQQFNDFPRNVGFNNGLSPAQPDMIEGLDLAQYDLFPIREDSLLKAAVPSSGPNAITLPHLAGEWKGPGKDMNLARHQAAYNGASMVYARDQACSFLGSPDPTSHAYVQTFTTDGTTLNTFAHYSTESQGHVTYHQYPTSSSFLVSSYEDYKTSRRRLRNLQDSAKEASEKLRDKLNEKWLANQYQPSASTSLLAKTVQQYQPPTSATPLTETVDARDGYEGYGDQGDGYDYSDQGDREASFQLLAEKEYYTSVNDQDGYNRPYTQQPPSSDGPQVLTTDDRYHPDTSHAQNYDPPVTPPYSYEDVHDWDTRGQRRTRQSLGHADNKARKTRK
jgi:hypothetical protein